MRIIEILKTIFMFTVVFIGFPFMFLAYIFMWF